MAAFLRESHVLMSQHPGVRVGPFEIRPADEVTNKLIKAREAVEFTAHCSMKWAIFLLSLKQLAENGSGMPSPDDVKIDDGN